MKINRFYTCFAVLLIAAVGRAQLSDATNIINDTDDEYTGRSLTEVKSVSKKVRDELADQRDHVQQYEAGLKQVRDRRGKAFGKGPNVRRAFQELYDWRSCLDRTIMRLNQFQIAYRSAFPDTKQPKKGDRSKLQVRFFNLLNTRTEELAEASFELADQSLVLLKSGKANDLIPMLAETTQILSSIAKELAATRETQAKAIEQAKKI